MSAYSIASSTRRALVIGASGQVGRALCAAFGRTYAVVAASHQHVQPGQQQVDLADAGGSLTRLYLEVRPEIVLLAGGMCNVDGCELEPDACRQVNVEGTRTVAENARESGAMVVFFSTDHVFSGCRELHCETDPVAPLNVYSESKARAEEVLRECLPDRHLIMRTSWVYGPDAYRRNFVLRLIDHVGQGRPLTVPEDQWGSPTWTEDLARAVRFLVERGETGTFHAAGPEFVSRVRLATRVCARFELDPALIVPRPTSSLGQVARRPLEVQLDCQKLAETGVERFRNIDAGLKGLRAWLTAPAELR